MLLSRLIYSINLMFHS